MTDVAKVILGLRCCVISDETGVCPFNCPYGEEYGNNCEQKLRADSLHLLDTGKKCETCKWRSDEFTSVCVNDRSDYLADFVGADWTCEQWEGKEDEAD